MRHTYFDRAPRLLLGILLVFAFLLALPALAHGQVVRTGWLPDSVRLKLAAGWNDFDANQHERGYCVTSYTIYVRQTLGETDSAFVVLDVGPGDVHASGTTWIDFDCAPGMPTIHTHPPTTCQGLRRDSACVMGGVEAFQAAPSRSDLHTLVRLGLPFAVIQADRYVVRFYYPADYQALPDSAGPPKMAITLPVG